VVLVGIAGGIHPSVSLGDVVVVQEVIYYDLRKETQAGVIRRGQTRPVPAVIRRAVNDFFSTHGEPYLVHSADPDGTFRDYKALPGPIGSGEAVIAYKGSDIRRYLTAFNDKTLAVETEAGGIAEAFYETADEPGTGWLAIRGISDHADADKDDAFHQVASWHAAATLIGLLPYLKHR
jgi:adenosylhomocysteine nucleosidase